jgi:type III restriction enzyme
VTKPIIPYDKDLPFIEGRFPHLKPDSYLVKDGKTYKLVSGRRSSNMLLVDKLRSDVDLWRESGYPGVTETTRDLLTYWFEQDHFVNGNRFRYYFAQREAIETIIFLIEVKKYTDLVPVIKEYAVIKKPDVLGDAISFQESVDGKRSIRRYIPEFKDEITQDLPEPNLLRYAFKMATGSGKTVVMALLMVWSYLNKRRENMTQLSENFLVVAPNVIVLERLLKDFADNKIFNQLPLIPPYLKNEWLPKVITRGDSSMPSTTGNIFVQNIQQLYESRANDNWTPENVVQEILGKPPGKDITKPSISVLHHLKNLPSLIVINDEAHHVHDDDLEWNKTLLTLHHTIDGGLKLWLDFSATPKNQNGTYFPWIIVDYPLAQAVEDTIVKAPIIIHRVDKKEPEQVTQENVTEVYQAWIVAALERWKEHTRFYESLSKKPVLFIMAEKNAFADKIADMLTKKKGIKPEEVLVIHTDNSGNIRSADIDKLRKTAREIDEPENKIRIVVSVMMLREGWDVQNVTVVLGLRPFSAKANILPEQAVGRGLRIITGISPDSRQTLEVIGNSEFEKLVRVLETEGVGVSTFSEPPPLPVKIQPQKSRLSLNIEIPQTELLYSHNYRQLSSIDPLSIDSLLDSHIVIEDEKIKLRMEFATTETEVGMTTVDIGPYLPTGGELASQITNRVIKETRLISSDFSQLYPIVRKYLESKCFGKQVDIENRKVRTILRNETSQKAITSILSKAFGQAVVVKNPIRLKSSPISLAETTSFVWRRKYLKCKKTIFNYVATFNDFESSFAQFLDDSDDIEKFAALAETFTGFKIDYLSTRGAIRFYYPDFVAVQKTPKGFTNWIIETKGREYEDTDKKDAAIVKWCKDISKTLNQDWRAIKISQQLFEKRQYHNFQDLVRSVIANSKNKSTDRAKNTRLFE